ncbi:MAG: heme lyase CcmF/NrfE family subunit [Maricaulaceae bacterium]
MIAEIGHIALILAFIIAALQAVLPMLGAAKGHQRLMTFGDRAAGGQFIALAVSFAALTVVFLQSDFSVKLAAMHSHTAKPLLYKISGVWANHEGSMLLWVLILGIYGALVPVFGKHLPAGLKARALSVQGMLGVGFMGFILLTSNPFERLVPMPADGQGLNPLLQDPGLAFHPPFLYLGYVGFSISFSFAIAALIEGRVDAVWAKWLRPWVLVAWSFLTIGITLGSFWAYYELGWGGWWMWDPVENVSFMPWLAGTALLHSILVLGRRHSFASWTVLLAITAFSLSLIGTFIVRSGVLVSVHTFAVDPERGIYILGLLTAATGGGLGLYAMRAAKLRSSVGVKFTSKDGALAINNLLLVIATVTVFLGTFYPLFMDAITGDKISVGAPYFDLTFGPIMMLLIVFMGIGPMFKWREDTMGRFGSFLLKAIWLGSAVAMLTYFIGRSVLGALSLAMCAYLAFGTLAALGRRINFRNVPFNESLRALRAQPASFYAFVMAHMGVAIFAAGVTAMSVWSADNAKNLYPGESVSVAGYTFTLNDVDTGVRENYQFMGAKVDITQNGKAVSSVHTERRYFPVRKMLTTEAGLHLSLRHSLFASLSEGNPEKGWVLRVYFHPYVVWIWIGALIMALAGFTALLGEKTTRRDTEGLS